MGARGSFKGAFSPSRVQQVQAGYFWDPAGVQNSGASTFLMPEGNGKSTYNMVTAAANTAPSIVTVNGQPCVEYTNAVPDELARTAAQVTRGFTGSAMIWGWVSCAVAPGIVLGHSRATTQFYLQLNGSDCRVGVNDGSSSVDSRFTNPTYANGPLYYEGVFDTSQAVATNRIQLWINRVQVTPNSAASPAALMQDSLDHIHFSGQASDNSQFNIAADFAHGVMGLTNGIPSADDRDRLFNYRRLA